MSWNAMPLPQISLQNITRPVTNIGVITGSGGYSNVTTWQSSDDVFVRKYEVVEASEDILALSVAWHRIRTSPLNPKSLRPVMNFSTLLQRELFDEVVPEDKLIAANIRDYYSKKIMMWKLKEQKLTHFREDLNTFIHGSPTKVTEKMLPLIYRLPEFFEYDVEFEEMIRGMNHEFAKPIPSEPVILSPLRQFTRKTRTLKKTEYWLKDENDHVYNFNLVYDNSLKPLWEREFKNNNITFSNLTLTKKVRDGLKYLVVHKFELG